VRREHERLTLRVFARGGSRVIDTADHPIHGDGMNSEGVLNPGEVAEAIGSVVGCRGPSVAIEFTRAAPPDDPYIPLPEGG